MKTQKICFSILYIHMKKHSNGFGSIYSSSQFGHEEPKKTNKIKEALNKAVTFISKKVKKQIWETETLEEKVKLKKYN